MKSIVSLLLASLGLSLLLLGSSLSMPAAGHTPNGSPTPTLTVFIEPLPPGVSVQTVLSATGGPLAMAFDPAGRLFFTEKQGNVRLVVNDVLQATPVITFAVENGLETGLLGIALDPAFSSNHYVYVYYTAAAPFENKVVRFVETNGVGSNPTEIFSSPQTAGNHAGGGLGFGPDGKLYFTTGDSLRPNDAQDVTVKPGKMHRINPDGTIPSDNPVFTETGALPSLFARGLRNSFAFTFDAVSANLFLSDNGPTCDDEINRMVGGANYGWRPQYPCDDGSPDPTYNTIPPLWYWGPGHGAPTGIEVYRGTSIPTWQNDLFLCAWVGQSLIRFRLDPTRTQLTGISVIDNVSCGLAVRTGPEGALYYSEFDDALGVVWLKRLIATTPTPGTATPTPIPPSSTPTVMAPSPTLTARPATNTPTDTPTTTGTPVPPTPTPTMTGPSPTHTPLPATGTSTPRASRTPTTIPASTPTGTPCPIQFSDVPPSQPFYVFIRCLACRQIVSGYADGSFRPGAAVTRGQLAKILANAAGLSTGVPSTQQTFSDVPTSNPFWLFVERLTTSGAISGYACGGPGEPCDPQQRPYFRWEANATRGQISKITAVTAGWHGPVPPTQQTFADVPPANPFWLWIEELARRTIIAGYSCGGPGEPCDPQSRPYFRWGLDATRGQMSKIAAQTFYPNCDTPHRR
jgi:glucose/arabinose dehydrogenase